MIDVKALILKRYREAGLILISLIYLLAYLTAKDTFWAGKATFFSAAVLLIVALLDLVKKNGMEKS